ncbi:MAG: TonB-dependent receptor [Myxococcales bacterium]|nr:TonB-dependent receptor [Myxococcales bacterium]
MLRRAIARWIRLRWLAIALLALLWRGPVAGAETALPGGDGPLAPGAELVWVLAPQTPPLDRVHRAEDLARSLPALEIHAPFVTDPNVYIRGIGQQHFYDNFTAPVAIYQDGVYANSSAGQLLESFDLSSATLRKGAQGSLYARNATAGALLLDSNKPDGNRSFATSVGYGNYDQVEVDGALGVPIAGDVLSARVAGAAHFRDGITRNGCRGASQDPTAGTDVFCDYLNRFWVGSNPNPNLFPLAVMGDFDGLQRYTNDVHDWAGRGLLRFQPSAAQDWLLKVHGARNRSDARHLQMRGAQRNVVANRPISQLYNNGQMENGFSEDKSPYYDLDPLVGWYEQDGEDRLDRLGASLRGEIDLGATRLVSTSAYWRRAHRVEDERDASPAAALATDWSDETWQASQELALEGEGAGAAWRTGAELLYEEGTAQNLFKGSNLSYIAQSTDQSLLSFAPYSHALWQPSAWWGVELGTRFVWERRRFDLHTQVPLYQRVIVAASLPFDDPDRYASGWQDCCAPYAVARIQPGLSAERDRSAVTGELRFIFTPSDDVRFYAQYARGYKGAQFYAESGWDHHEIFEARPETVHAFEGGVRSMWLDGALGFDAAVFFADTADMQVFDLANDVWRSSVGQLLNSDARVLGVDAELRLTPLPGLRAQLGFGWLDAAYRNFQVRENVQSPFVGQVGKPLSAYFDYSGNPLVGAPRYRFSARVDYTLQLGRRGALLPSLIARFRSKTYFSVDRLEELAQPAYWLLDARLAYRSPDARFEIAGWVRNLADQRYLTDAFNQSIATSEFLYVYADPRLFGATLSVRW